MSKQAPESKPTVPSFKQLIKLICEDEKPRGLKVAKNDAGAYTFSYGPKSAPICVIASASEVAEAGLGLLGLKLVKAS